MIIYLYPLLRTKGLHTDNLRRELFNSIPTQTKKYYGNYGNTAFPYYDDLHWRYLIVVSTIPENPI